MNKKQIERVAEALHNLYLEATSYIAEKVLDMIEQSEKLAFEAGKKVGRQEAMKKVLRILDKHMEECEPHNCCGDEIKDEIKEME